MTDYTPQTGLDDETTRQWHELTQTKARRPIGAMTRFWSEHVSTSDGTQFTVTHAEPPPDDAPGEDCPDHGPYGDDDCPKCGCGAPATTLVHCRGTHRLCDECYQREFEDNYEEYRGWESEPLRLPCTACHTTDYVMSSTRPGLCLGCANALHFGFGSRFEAERFAKPVRAATLQSIAIEARIFVCKNCQGIHPTQKCPELRFALFAEEPAIAVYETHEMVRLWSVSRTLLVTKLRRLTRPQLVCQAVAFAAWLDERTQAGLSAASVLHIWETMLDDGPTAPAAMMRAA